MLGATKAVICTVFSLADPGFDADLDESWPGGWWEYLSGPGGAGKSSCRPSPPGYDLRAIPDKIRGCIPTRSCRRLCPFSNAWQCRAWDRETCHGNEQRRGQTVLHRVVQHHPRAAAMQKGSIQICGQRVDRTRDHCHKEWGEILLAWWAKESPSSLDRPPLLECVQGSVDLADALFPRRSSPRGCWTPYVFGRTLAQQAGLNLCDYGAKESEVWDSMQTLPPKRWRVFRAKGAQKNAAGLWT